MKKLLLVLAVAAFVACNDSGTTEETPAADTTPVTTAPAPDTTVTVTPDTTKPAGDTSAIKK